MNHGTRRKNPNMMYCLITINSGWFLVTMVSFSNHLDNNWIWFIWIIPHRDPKLEATPWTRRILGLKKLEQVDDTVFVFIHLGWVDSPQIHQIGPWNEPFAAGQTCYYCSWLSTNNRGSIIWITMNYNIIVIPAVVIIWCYNASWSPFLKMSATAGTPAAECATQGAPSWIYQRGAIINHDYLRAGSPCWFIQLFIFGTMDIYGLVLAVASRYHVEPGIRTGERHRHWYVPLAVKPCPEQIIRAVEMWTATLFWS